MERAMGIEPTLAAWEAAVLPLNYTRVMGKSKSARRARASVSSAWLPPLSFLSPRPPIDQPSAYRYSTNDATAPSNPCTLGLVDSMR